MIPLCMPSNTALILEFFQTELALDMLFSGFMDMCYVRLAAVTRRKQTRTLRYWASNYAVRMLIFQVRKTLLCTLKMNAMNIAGRRVPKGRIDD